MSFPLWGQKWESPVSVPHVVSDRLKPVNFLARPTEIGRSETKLKGLNPGLRTPMYPYVALRCPTYRENSHANHTWNPQLHQTTYFEGSEAMPVWVRFPSPAPLSG
jgi:hypothetical protein